MVLGIFSVCSIHLNLEKILILGTYVLGFAAFRRSWCRRPRWTTLETSQAPAKPTSKAWEHLKTWREAWRSSGRSSGTNIIKPFCLQLMATFMETQFVMVKRWVYYYWPDSTSFQLVKVCISSNCLHGFVQNNLFHRLWSNQFSKKSFALLVPDREIWRQSLDWNPWEEFWRSMTWRSSARRRSPRCRRSPTCDEGVDALTNSEWRFILVRHLHHNRQHLVLGRHHSHCKTVRPVC